MPPTWDILICSIEHRTDHLATLLAELTDQIAIDGGGSVGVRVFRDNLETGYGAKCQALLDSSAADYVCFVDDDDMVSVLYVQEIVAAIASRPDYVGFDVHYTEGGVYQLPVTHSLQCDGWINHPDGLYRDLSQINPIRRDLAIQAKWEGDNGADRRWVDRLRALGCVKTEVFIPLELYHYQHSMGDSMQTSPKPPLTVHPSRPDFPFVSWI